MIKMENDFIVNENLTINEFKLIDDKIHTFLKFGVEYDYKEFNGLIKGEKVKGFVCLEDDNIYKMEYIK